MTTITWPTDLVAQTCDFRLQKNTLRSISPIAKTVQTMDRQGKRWMAQLRFRVGRAKGQRIQALLDSGDEFSLWDMAHSRGLPLGPNLDRSSIAVTYFYTAGSPGGQTRFRDGGSPTVRTGFSGGAAGVRIRGGWAVGSSEPLSDGWVANSTPLLGGDYVQIGDYLYMLTEDLDADGFGRAYLPLNRGLLAAAAHRDLITRTRPRAMMLLQDDDQNQRPVTPDQLWEFNLSFFEKLPV